MKTETFSIIILSDKVLEVLSKFTDEKPFNIFSGIKYST